MPTYDYICDGCGHEFEAYESIKSDSQKTCPQCHEEKLRRKIGAGAAILFKGSGFYQTDYRSDSYKTRAEADKPSESPAKPSESSTPAAANKTESPKASDSNGKAS
jgi:putative FmdB family regulatory protein